MKIRASVLLVLICVCCVQVRAQLPSNSRCSTRIIDSVVCRIDTLPIIPETFTLSGLDPSEYHVDFVTSTLVLYDENLVGRLVTCSYRVFSFDFSQSIKHKSTDLILPRLIHDPDSRQLISISPMPSNTIFDSQLQGTGSVSRSVSVGNNQNFVLDAHLNLQLSGKLSPDVEILANITDENLPVQPEGNTRYIKDFNKVFLQLKYKDILKVNAGDIEFASPDNTYFFQVTRQFLGLNLQVDTRFDSVNKMSNRVGGGITKGKYVRNVITPIHGVQGPYKLYGEQNETNIVVLSASEQVYLDGVLLTRGQDNDYVIDYNLGEVTFTAKHLITSESRIIINFEYSDQYYSRYNLYTSNSFVHERNHRLMLDVNFFHEQDMKRQSIMPELSQEQMLFLSGIGDQIGAAQTATATLISDVVGNEVLYHQVDTIVDGRIYRVFVYAEDSKDSVYRVSFSHVGHKAGNYVLSMSTVNGKLYQWVAPVNGEPQGDYEPVQLLNTPKQHDLATIGMTYSLRERFKVNAEFGFSYQDDNLFSKLDDGDNVGLAGKITLSYQTPLKIKAKRDSLWKYMFALQYEFVHQNFSPFNSFREVEFFREYNLESDYSAHTSEQIWQFSTGFVHPDCGATKLTVNGLNRFGDVFALRSAVISNHHFKGWHWQAGTSFLTSRDAVQTTDFLKSGNDFSKVISKVRIGVRDNLEYNVFRLSQERTLRDNSYAFNEAIFYLTNSDSTGYDYHFLVKNRVDAVAYQNVLSLNAVAHEAQASLAFSRWKHNRLNATLTYRYDKLRDTARNFVGEHNFVGSLDYAGNFWKGAVNLGLYYETGNGREQKRTYTFLRVAAGQGTHVWNDYNHNGIEELEEFELAVFQNEADYVKVWLTTNEYVQTTNNAATASLQLRPANIWRGEQGFRAFLSRFTNVTHLRVSQKNQLHNRWQALNPFHFHTPDSLLFSQTLNFKNSLTFALPTNYFSADYTVMFNRAKNMLYYGLQSDQLSHQRLTLRTNPVRWLTISTMYTRSMKDNRTQYMLSRNFQILSHVLENAVTLNLKCNLSMTALCAMTYKLNLLSAEKTNMYQARLDADYRMREKGTVQLSVQYVKVFYNTTLLDNTLSYEMLDGLSVGDNFLWNFSYQTKLFEFLQLNVQYEGRLTDSGRLIHTGYLQLKAFF